jgi:hypothetical protein
MRHVCERLRPREAEYRFVLSDPIGLGHVEVPLAASGWNVIFQVSLQGASSNLGVQAPRNHDVKGALAGRVLTATRCCDSIFIIA